MKVATARQMREIDRVSIEQYKIPGIVLMENAGLQIVRAIEQFVGGSVSGKRVVIVAGSGNNGGDGFVVARHLANLGAGVQVVLAADPTKMTDDARSNYEILQHLGIEITIVKTKQDVERTAMLLAWCDLVVDGLFGTGFRGQTEGLPAAMIELMNSVGKPIIAIDIPSGLDSDNGQAAGLCVCATLTVTLGLPKPGLLVYPGAGYVGRLIVVDISLPSPLVTADTLTRHIITADGISMFYPWRRPDSHKGSNGRILIVAGSRKLTGAAALCAMAAVRGGAGLVTVAVPESAHAFTAAKINEAMVVPLPETNEGTIALTAFEEILALAEKSQVVAIGPGLGNHAETTGLVKQLLLQLKVPMILDADGLNAIAETPAILKEAKAPVMITPHPGEMARLLGVATSEVQGNRWSVAEQAAKDLQTIVVLKGARTIVGMPEGWSFVNSTGNAGLATGGTGDVLTGLLAALVAQGLTMRQAAIAGVYLHGMAADIVEEQKGAIGLSASDIAESLPLAFKQLSQVIARLA